MTPPSQEKQPEAASKSEAEALALAWELAELRNVYKYAPVGFYSVDLDFRFVHINEYWARLHGQPVADHIGRTVREMVPGIADKVEPILRRVIHSRRAVLDVRFRWTPRAAVQGAVDRVGSYYPIKDEGGVVIGVSAVIRDLTEQSRVKRALREQEERYRLLFEKANDGLFVFLLEPDGTPGKFIEANEVACRMMGYSRDEIVQISPSELRAPSLSDPNYFLRLAIDKRQVVFERELRTKTGAIVPAEISAILFELEGKPAILSSVRDISERKKSAAELKSSIDLNEQILSSAQQGVIVTDRDLRIVVWNAFLEGLSGISRQKAMGRNAFELLPFLRNLGIEEITRRALAGEYFARLEWPFEISETGKSGWVSVSTGPLWEGNGRIIGTLSILRDITGKKRMEAALRESDELNVQIIQNIGEGIAVCDREMKPLLWNPFMEEMSGFSAERVRGRSLLDSFPFLRKQGIDHLFGQALQGQSFSMQEIPYDVPETRKFGWAAAHFCPLRNLEGQITGVLINVRDINESKRREEDLRRLSSRLLRAEDQERRRIARDLHDSFAQRVLAVNLNLALLDRYASPLNERARRALIETREIMGEFSKEIRSLSYILHPPVLDELGLASAVEELAAGFSERTGIDVDIEIAPHLKRLPQDTEVALFRVVQEALSNVQRHSGSPTAEIRLIPKDHQLMLEVADQGCWKSRKPSLNATAEADRLGVGVLGMRERIRQLGGVLEITSDSGGTTVRAVLPLQGEDSADPGC